MADELRQAVERMGKDWNRMSSCYDEQANPRREYLEDLCRIADAYLREHDPTPIDADWLRSVGFDYEPDYMMVGSGHRIWHASKRLDFDTTLIVREDETLIDVGRTYWPCETVKTRGDVIRLCAALGVQLEENNG